MCLQLGHLAKYRFWLPCTLASDAAAAASAIDAATVAAAAVFGLRKRERV